MAPEACTIRLVNNQAVAFTIHGAPILALLEAVIGTLAMVEVLSSKIAKVIAVRITIGYLCVGFGSDPGNDHEQQDGSGHARHHVEQNQYHGDLNHCNLVCPNFCAKLT